jgi:cyclopropane-fatty-acyl-phospholipid synthase
MYLLSKLLNSIIRQGELAIIDADGQRHVFGDGNGPRATIRLHDKALHHRLVTQTELATGEGYMDGTITLEEGSSLKDLMNVYGGNRHNVDANRFNRWLARASKLFRGIQQSNRLGEATQHVSHHYDIGNDFYKLFLDKSLLYSCAYFENPDDSLEVAQQNKLRHLAAKMDLKAGQKVLDIGSGWGDLALYLAKISDVDVTGITLSREQYELSNTKAREAGLETRVRFELRDYRQMEGEFDRIVSVGMFEHVGVVHYDEFFNQLNRLMSSDGLTVLHSIGRMLPPSTTGKWVRKYIFPGGYTPSLSEVFAVVERKGLWVLDVEILRLHYARTVAFWFANFQKNRKKVVAMYDERFARMWEFYLAGAEMAFRHGGSMVFQMQLARKQEAAPLTRGYMIEGERSLKILEKKTKI